MRYWSYFWYILLAFWILKQVYGISIAGFEGTSSENIGNGHKITFIGKRPVRSSWLPPKSK